MTKNQIGLQFYILYREYSRLVCVSAGPTKIEADIIALIPTKFSQALPQCFDVRLSVLIVFASSN